MQVFGWDESKQWQSHRLSAVRTFLVFLGAEVYMAYTDTVLKQNFEDS